MNIDSSAIERGGAPLARLDQMYSTTRARLARLATVMP